MHQFYYSFQYQKRVMTKMTTCYFHCHYNDSYVIWINQLKNKQCFAIFYPTHDQYFYKNVYVLNVLITDDVGWNFMINSSLEIINEVVKQTVWSHQFFLSVFKGGCPKNTKITLLHPCQTTWLRLNNCYAGFAYLISHVWEGYVIYFNN